MSECKRLLIGMSITGWLPPIGTAGFDRCTVSGNRREPWPPPRTIARTSLFIAIRNAHDMPASHHRRNRGVVSDALFSLDHGSAAHRSIGLGTRAGRWHHPHRGLEDHGTARGGRRRGVLRRAATCTILHAGDDEPTPRAPLRRFPAVINSV